MHNFHQWPILKVKESSLHDEQVRLEYERAVWGKVHNQASDFRWIARSKGFNEENIEVGRLLNLGAEDLPKAGTFQWLEAGDRFFAVQGYPSHAVDLSGRRGFLEKQIIEWKPKSHTPLFWGMVAFYHQLKKFTDKIWWAGHNDPNWSESDYVLPIDPDRHKPIDIGEEKKEQYVEDAIASLNQEVQPEELKEIYIKILTRDFPIILPERLEPLPLLSFAALHLPLSPPFIRDAQMSFAGWIPSERVQENLFTSWKFISLPKYLNKPERGFVEASDDIRKKAAVMAEAIVKNDPTKLNIEKEKKDPGKQARPTPVPKKEPKTEQSKEKAGSFLPFKKTVDITKLPPDAPPEMKEIYDYARNVNSRNFMKNISDIKGFLSSEKNSVWKGLLYTWIEELDEKKPSYVNDRQWEIKLDFLKALAIVFAPGEQLSTLKLPQSGVVSPVLFLQEIWDVKDFTKFLNDRYGSDVEKEMLLLNKKCQSQAAYKELKEFWKNGIESTKK